MGLATGRAGQGIVGLAEQALASSSASLAIVGLALQPLATAGLRWPGRWPRWLSRP